MSNNDYFSELIKKHHERAKTNHNPAVDYPRASYDYRDDNPALIATDIDKYIPYEYREAYLLLQQANIFGSKATCCDNYRYLIFGEGISLENQEIFNELKQTDDRYFSSENGNYFIRVKISDTEELASLVGKFKTQQVPEQFYETSEAFFKSFQFEGTSAKELEVLSDGTIKWGKRTPNPDRIDKTLEDALVMKDKTELYIPEENKVFKNKFYLEAHRRYIESKKSTTRK